MRYSAKEFSYFFQPEEGQKTFEFVEKLQLALQNCKIVFQPEVITNPFNGNKIVKFTIAIPADFSIQEQKLLKEKLNSLRK